LEVNKTKQINLKKKKRKEKKTTEKNPKRSKMLTEHQLPVFECWGFAVGSWWPSVGTCRSPSPTALPFGTISVSI